MTKPEKKVQIALGTYLSSVWEEGSKLYNEGNKLYAEGSKLYNEGNKLYAEGRKLYAKGNKLHAKGDLLFFNAVIEVYGKKEVIEGITRGYKVRGVEYRW